MNFNFTIQKLVLDIATYFFDKAWEPFWTPDIATPAFGYIKTKTH